jgi:predicted transcriptional regulator
VEDRFEQFDFGGLPMTRKLYEIAADIIEAQASFTQMSPGSLEESLSTVFVTLQRMKLAEDGGFLLDAGKPPEEPVQEVAENIDPKKSIQEDKVICLECQAEMKQLTAKHLGSHGLTIREYKKKYGFPQRQSLSAKSLSKARSKAAKKRGLPEKLVQFQAQRKQDKMEAAMKEGAGASNAPMDKPKTKAPAKRGRKKKSE